MPKKMSWVFIFLLIISSACGKGTNTKAESGEITTYRDIPGVTAEEMASIEKIKAETTRFSFGHIWEDEAYASFTSKFCAFLSEIFEAEFEPVPYDGWQPLKTDLDSHIIGFTDDITPATTLKHQYHSTAPFAERTQKIISLKESDIATEDDVNGLTLGFLQNSANVELILRRYNNLTFQQVTVDYIASVEGLLYSGAIDAFVAESNVVALFDGNENVQIQDFFPLANTPVSLTTANPDLTPFISVINKYLLSGGIDKLNDMYKDSEYEYTKIKLLESFTEEELAYLNTLAARGTGVNIALENDNYPLCFYNTTEESFQGIAVDILDEVGKLTGIEFVNTTTEDSTWSEILEALKSKQVSIVSQLGYSEARTKYFLWSRVSYNDNNYALISKADRAKVENYRIPRMKVGVTQNTIYEDVYNTWFPDFDNLTRYPTQNSMLDALEKGEIDLIIGAENVLLMQTNYREKTGYILNYRFNTSMPSYLGFNSDERILRDIIDKSFSHIDLESITGYWDNRLFDYSKIISQVQTGYLTIFVLSLFAALLLTVFLLLRNYGLRKSLVKHITTLDTIYKAMPDLVFSKDINNVFTSCNLSFEQYAGLTEAELLGKTDTQISHLPEKEAAAHWEADRRVMDSATVETIEESVTYPDHTVRLLETIKVPLIENGKTVGMLGIGRNVTERNEVMSRMNRIVNTAQVAFMLSLDGIVMEANEYAMKHFDLKPGDNTLTIYVDKDRRSDIINLVEESGTVSNIVIELYIASGEKHRFLASYTSVEYDLRKAYLFWALDIEQNELERERFFAVQQSFQTVLDILPVPVRIVDLESGCILYVNNSLLALLGYEKAEELCGLRIEEILPEVMSDGTQSAERVKMMLEVVDFVSVEIEYLTPSGKIIEALVATRQIDYQGKPASIGIIKDLSAEKERERMLLEAAEREKVANQSKSMFLANMSHEIRTPMNGVIGMTDLLLGEQLSSRQMQYVKDIRMSAISLLDIINDILDLSKITEGRLQIVLMDVDLSGLLKNIVSMMSFSAFSKGLEFIDDIQINAPEYVRVDDVRLKQILVNLLSNAIKFTKEGYVKLSVTIEGGQINFKISDTGTGIRKDEIPLIFLAFEQADKRKNRAIKGTGLGLSISKNLADLMGGKIYAESEYGKGSVFYLTIPYVKGDEAATEAPDTVFEYISAPKAQILLVDDIQTNLTVGAGLLRRCNITADIAVSGQEAIDLVKVKDYDIIFMDHMMPEMDGIEAMLIIRSMGEKYLNLPIIALTANAVNESRDFLLSSGMDDFLSKPIDKNMLMSILNKWLPKDKIEMGVKPEGEGTTHYSEVLKIVSAIDGLDIELALNRIGGMHDVLEASIQQMMYSISDRLKVMDASLAGGDLHTFAINAHGLKGALANIGATRNSELAAALEIAAKADNRPLCLEKFATFADELEGFAKKLKSIFTSAETVEKTSGDHERLAEQVSKVIGCIDDFDAEEALRYINAVMQFTYGAKTDAFLAKAKEHVCAFQYNEASLVLKSLLRE